MIFYKPISDISKIKKIYCDYTFDSDFMYGAYIGLDEESNEVKGKCKLKARKNYFAFEIRQGENDSYLLVGGSPVFNNK